MDQKLKIVILVLVILLGISLSIVFSIQNSKLALLREYNDTKQRLTQENEKLTNKLNTILAENRGLKDRLEAIQADLQRITAERDQNQESYVLASKEKMELVEKLKSYPRLQEDIESFQSGNKALKEKISSLEENELALKAELDKLRQNNQGLKQKLKEARYASQERIPVVSGIKRGEQEANLAQEPELRSVDLPPIVVSSQPSFDDINLPSLLEGEVLDVNTEYNFVVINLGREAGISEGMFFQVFRDDELLGKVEVIQLREEISACDIIEVDMPFKTGDIVRY